MDTNNITPTTRKNKHLNAFERGQIELLHKDGLSPYAIAKKLGRSPNTIRNELKRGTVVQIKGIYERHMYFPETGEAVYMKNRKRCGKKFRILECSDFINYVEEKFTEKHHSLDSIVGAALVEGKFRRNEIVCTKTLYNYVSLGILSKIKNIDLPLKLRRSTKKSRTRQNKRKLGTSITERPEEINERKEFGHWEIDTVIGKKSKSDAVLLTLTERLSRKEIIMKVDSKQESSVLEAMQKLIDSMENMGTKIFKSITSDNGSEFSTLSKLEEQEIKIYFTHPYSAFERGTNERHNGLIRRFIPKGKSINDYSIDAIVRIEEWMNTLPRKILGYRTPNYIFNRQIDEILSA